MRHITVSRRIDAPRDAVWSVLADFPNIVAFTEGERGRTRRHLKAVDSGEDIENLLRKTVSQVGLITRRAEVREGKDRD